MKPFKILVTAALLATSAANAGQLANVSRLDLQAARFGADASGRLVGANLRAISATTDLDDYVTAIYARQPGGMGLTVQDTKVFPDIGVFEDDSDGVFASQAPITPSLVQGSTNLPADSVINLTSSGNTPLTMAVTPRLGLSFVITNPSDDFWFVIESASGDRTEKLYPAGSSQLSAATYFLASETVKLYFIPVNDASVSLGFRYGVENRFPTDNLTYGSNFITTLPALRAYQTRKATLAAGSRLDLSVMSGGNGAVSLRILYQDSTIVERFDGLTSGVQVPFVPEKTGDYYIMLVRTGFASTSSVSITCRATLTAQIPFADWQKRFAIEPAKRGTSTDADGDGQSNLEEYALGGDPADKQVSGLDPTVAKNGGNIEFRVIRPDYVTGVAYGVESSPNLANFATKPLQVRDNFGSDELYFGTSLSGQPRQFYRLLLSAP